MRSITLALAAIVFAIAPSTKSKGEDATLLLRVRADFQNGEMVITDIDPNGPAARLSNAEIPMASLEAGDVVEAIDGARITNHDSLVAALNRSVDGYVRVSVRNVQNGQVVDFWTDAQPTGQTPYAIARDACLRAVRSNSVAVQQLGFKVTDQLVMSMLSSTLKPITNHKPSADEKFRNLMVGLIAIRDDRAFVETIGTDVFQTCDAKMEDFFERLSGASDPVQENAIADDAIASIRTVLNDAITDFAKRTNRKTVEKATAPQQVYFRVQCDISGASVQLMTVADKVITLAKRDDSIGNPSENAIAILNQSQRWITLPQENAGAYGRFYYRFVNGNATKPLTDFNPERIITITPTAPVNGTIIFNHE